MSGDIFADSAPYAPSAPASPIRLHYGFGRAQSEESCERIPRDPEMQKIVDAMNAESDVERARKEAEMNTPENLQKAAEAEAAERKRKWIDFHFCRAMPVSMKEGWKHIGPVWTNEEIRVYTTDYYRRRFWGIKPAGMDIMEFWEQNDPEVARYDDNIAMTWANPLIPPPVTKYDENNPVIWAGPGQNPDLAPSEPPVVKVTPPTKTAAKPRKRQKIPDLNPNHRVTKSTTGSSKVNKNTRRSLTDNIDASLPQLADQAREAALANHANGRPTRNQATITASSAQQKRTAKRETTNDGGSAPMKRTRGRPAATTKPAAKNEGPKRRRGRPPVKEKRAEESSTTKKTPAVNGNARVMKSWKTGLRPSTPSTHKMRTRREGPAELLQLP